MAPPPPPPPPGATDSNHPPPPPPPQQQQQRLQPPPPHTPHEEQQQQQYVIIGGGIAGCTAAEELLALLPCHQLFQVTILTATPVVKQVGKVVQVTRKLEEVEVVERDAQEFGQGHPNLRVVQAKVRNLNVAEHLVECEGGLSFPFDKCLVCTGATPKLVSSSNPHVVGIRDTESVQDLARRLKSARRVLVLGNGGIALEVVHEVIGCELIWAVKDAYVGNTFFDHTASGFVLPQLEKRRPVHIVENKHKGEQGGTTSMTVSAREEKQKSHQPSAAAATATEKPPSQPVVPRGGALGPDWTEGLSNKLTKNKQEQQQPSCTTTTTTDAKPLTILFNAELEELIEPSSSSPPPSSPSSSSNQHTDTAKEWPLSVRLTNGQTWGCDFIVSATGVLPLTSFLGPEFTRGEDGGVLVNEHMQTTASEDVYAAGDCCSMTWPESDVWFQMRLWTQARTMARYAARCMCGEVDELGSGFAFELFAHMTRFFGFPVALLGCFNAQFLRDEEQKRLIQEIKVVRKTPKEGGGGGGEGEEEATMEVQAPTMHLMSSEGEKGGGKGGGGDEQPSTATTNVKSKVEILTRLTPGLEYIKVVVVEGRVKGAMLVGEGTELAETFENLILNQLDVSAYGVDLLDPDVDIDDYFD